MKKSRIFSICCMAAAVSLTACVQTAQTQPSSESLTQNAAMAEESVKEDYMTMEQLQKLKEAGKVDYILSDQGYVTWLTGNYYDGVIKGEAEVMAVLDHMRDVLGMDEDTRFIKGTAIVDDNGYTYYTVKQFSGGITVQFAIAKVITNPDGKAVALSSSIQPGTGAEMDSMISEEKAAETVRDYLKGHMPETEYLFYSDVVGKTILSFGEPGEGGYAAAYVVYTDNPEASAETTDMDYLAHYVAGDGRYLYNIPVCSIEDAYAQSGSNADIYFQGKEEAFYSGEVTLQDGSKKQVTVPVLYDAEEKLYYLADAERKIAVMDGYTFSYDKSVALRSTPDNIGWNEKDLITYDNYLKIYDFYADMGCRSTDGLGTPIAILSDVRDENGEQEEGAFYSGKERGWHLFGSSYLNNYGECMDALAHEYAHGFNYASFTDFLYAGEYGAINEGFSDILGNLAERICEGSEDPEWLIGESSGEAIRSMSNPNAFGQPGFIGDAFYVPMNLEPTPFNDYAGVHVNNSLLSIVAVDFDRAGMTPEEQRKLWITASCAMTPLTGFKELKSILIHAAEIGGLGQWTNLIEDSFTNRGLTQDLENFTWPDVERCGRIRFSAESSDRYEIIRVMLLDPETNRPKFTWVTSPDAHNVVEFQYPEGDYVIGLHVLDYEDLSAPKRFVYTADGWAEQDENSEPLAVSMEYGKFKELDPVGW